MKNPPEPEPEPGTAVPDAGGAGGRAADTLVETLTKLITSGALRVGDPLPPEREIVQTYGVSRTVVREAVLALASKGLVQARPRFRPVVSKPSFDTAFASVDSVVGRLLLEPDGVRNLFETRIMIETSLVRQAATSAVKEDLQTLKQALDRNEATIDDTERFYLTDIDFHAALYTVPRNPVLPAIHKAYTTWLGPQWARMPRKPDRNRRNFQAHARIYDAILMRDADGAEAALRDHLNGAWDQVRETFGNL